MLRNDAQRLRHFQKMVKRRQQQILGINHNLVRPKVSSKSIRKAHNKLKLPKGTFALMSLRPSLPIASTKEAFDAKVRAIVGSEAEKDYSRTALEKTPLNRAELKIRLFDVARRVGTQRRAQHRVTQLNEQLKAFTKARNHFVMVLTAGDLFKLKKITLPKVDVPQLRKMIQDNPKLSGLSKLFDYEITFANSESEQRQMFLNAQTFGKVLKTGKGFVVIELSGRTGSTKKIIFSSYNGIREEAKKGARIISRGLTQIKKELAQNQKEANAKIDRTEVSQLTSPLIKAYRNLGKGELTPQARREIYEKYGGEEESARRALIEEEQKVRAAKLAQRIMPLKNAQNDVGFMLGVYERLAKVGSFSEGVNLMASSQSAINLVAKGYVKALTTLPELLSLARIESTQLMLPESEADMIRTLILKGMKPKKVIGKAVIIRQKDELYVMPTDMATFKSIVQVKINAIREALNALNEQIEIQSKS